MKISVLLLVCGLAKASVPQVPVEYTFPALPPWLTTPPTRATPQTEHPLPGQGGQYWPGYPSPSSITPKTEGPTKRPPIKLVGKLTPSMCREQQYKHLRACFYALNKIYQARLDVYTRGYLCKEWRAKEQKEAAERGTRQVPRQNAANRALGVPSHAASPGIRSGVSINNPCTTSGIPIAIEMIEAEDMNGNVVELLADIKNQLFQTFYTKVCSGFTLHLFQCEVVHAVVETPVYVDDGDGNPDNDLVTLKKVKIPVDCALHMT